MAATCTICAHPARADLDASLNAGESGRSLAAKHGMSLASIYRHIRSGHAQAAQQPQGTIISPSNVPTISPAISATLRDVQRLAREAQRHLKAARQGSDLKATNGAITAAAKALELVGKLRGELQQGGNVNVTVTADMRQAVDSHAQAQQLAPHDVTEQARAYLAAQLEAGDAEAIRAVLALVRMVPGADATGDVPAT